MSSIKEDIQDYLELQSACEKAKAKRAADIMVSKVRRKLEDRKFKITRAGEIQVTVWHRGFNPTLNSTDEAVRNLAAELDLLYYRVMESPFMARYSFFTSKEDLDRAWEFWRHMP